MEVRVMERIDIFGVIKYFYPNLELDPFLVETELVIFDLFYILVFVFLELHLLLFLLLILVFFLLLIRN